MLSDFLSLLFPESCIYCGMILKKGESHLCTICLTSLPKMGEDPMAKNLVDQRLWGKLPFEHSYCFLKYIKGGLTQKILFELKYEGNYKLGFALGRWFGASISNNSAYYDNYHLLPVPLHRKKQRKRGFNQSQVIAEGMSSILKLPIIENAIVRTQDKDSQTRKNRWNRWFTSEGIYVCQKPGLLQGKKLLLVDDVITTGATFEAVGNVALSAGCSKLSIASVAAAV